MDLVSEINVYIFYIFIYILYKQPDIKGNERKLYIQNNNNR